MMMMILKCLKMQKLPNNLPKQKKKSNNKQKKKSSKKNSTKKLKINKSQNQNNPICKIKLISIINIDK